MGKNELLRLLLKSKYNVTSIDVEKEERAIRFRIGGTRYRLNGTLVVEECAGELLGTSDETRRMERELERVRRGHVPTKKTHKMFPDCCLEINFEYDPEDDTDHQYCVSLELSREGCFEDESVITSDDSHEAIIMTANKVAEYLGIDDD